MPAPEGNHYWKFRNSHGRAPIFATPEDLWDACVSYFEWVEDNPLHETKAFAHQGIVTTAELPKMRAMTISGLCIHLEIDEQTWRNYGQREDFLGIVSKVENIIRTQKFEGAAAGLLSASIIARELGLADRQEVSGPNGGPVQTIPLGELEVARRLAFLLTKGALDADREE